MEADEVSCPLCQASVLGGAFALHVIEQHSSPGRPEVRSVGRSRPSRAVAVLSAYPINRKLFRALPPRRHKSSVLELHSRLTRELAPAKWARRVTMEIYRADKLRCLQRFELLFSLEVRVLGSGCKDGDAVCREIATLLRDTPHLQASLRSLRLSVAESVFLYRHGSRWILNPRPLPNLVTLRQLSRLKLPVDAYAKLCRLAPSSLTHLFISGTPSGHLCFEDPSYPAQEIRELLRQQVEGLACLVWLRMDVRFGQAVWLALSEEARERLYGQLRRWPLPAEESVHQPPAQSSEAVKEQLFRRLGGLRALRLVDDATLGRFAACRSSLRKLSLHLAEVSAEMSQQLLSLSRLHVLRIHLSGRPELLANWTALAKLGIHHLEIQLGSSWQDGGSDDLTLHAPPSLRSLRLDFGESSRSSNSLLEEGRRLMLTGALPLLRRISLNGHPSQLDGLLQADIGDLDTIHWCFQIIPSCYGMERLYLSDRSAYFTGSFAGPQVGHQFQAFLDEMRARLGAGKAAVAAGRALVERTVAAASAHGPTLPPWPQRPKDTPL